MPSTQATEDMIARYVGFSLGYGLRLCLAKDGRLCEPDRFGCVTFDCDRTLKVKFETSEFV